MNAVPFRRRLLVAVVVVAVVGPLAALTTSAGAAPARAAAPARTTRASPLRRTGAVNLRALAGRRLPAAGTKGPETREIEVEKHVKDEPTAGGPLSPAPNPKPSPVATSNPGFRGLFGLSHYDQRFASGGNSFSTEPPDQGLCVGNGFVVDSVNAAVSVRGYSGDYIVPPISLNEFYGLAPAITRRTDPPTFGPNIGDPKCVYDAGVDRFFLTNFNLDTDTVTGDLTGGTSVALAVSQTGDPTGTWTTFDIPTTNDGTEGTAVHPHCPCIGDQPLIGTDRNAFYISTNEFSLFGDEFNGAQLYVTSKARLAAAASGGGLPRTLAIDVGVLEEGPSYSLQPAQVSPGVTATTDTGYFLSALDFEGTSDNRIAVWALTGTSTLGTSTPAVTLLEKTLVSEPYASPLPTVQKNGPRPLGESLGAPPNRLDGGDDRMESAGFSKGRVFGTLDTRVAQNQPRVGVAWFDVRPVVKGGVLNASILAQGYVTHPNLSVNRGYVAVNQGGKAVIAYSVVGPGRYPSTGYSLLADGNSGPLHFANKGVGPADGFTGYEDFGGTGVERWGDYSAASFADDGTFWFASEWIPPGPRSSLANWGTFIGQLDPTP